MVTDRQVKRLRRVLSLGLTLRQAADKANMDEKTARKYRLLAAARDWTIVAAGGAIGRRWSAAAGG